MRPLEYIALLAAATGLAWLASFTGLADQIDKDAYDTIFRLHRPADWQPESVLLDIDEESLRDAGGIRAMRAALAESLELLSAAAPRAVAVDVILPDAGDPALDARLANAIRASRNVVLSADLRPDGFAWEDPLPRFRESAAGVGHVHAEPDQGVNREILLEKRAGRDRRWALALEAYRVARQTRIVESPGDVEIGGVVIPASQRTGRVMRIRYRPPDRAIPRVALRELKANPQLGKRFANKTVFVGSTAQTLARDRLQTPYSVDSVPMAGVEIHANVFETIAARRFLTDAPAWITVLWSLALAAGAGLVFARLSGWLSYLGAAAILAASMAAPYLSFTQSVVLPFNAPVMTAWFTLVTAATYRYFIARIRMLKAEADKARYQQAIHFVTHEMRTPLTAIQGSSELIGRYAMTDDKRKQIAQIINSESKRLGKMIQIFLDVERLSAGQLELKQEPFDGAELMSACVERVRPLAERKQIRITLDSAFEAALTGDRELMDYAFYNLLTNAVKYSSAKTEVNVYSRRDGDRVRLSVQDQGIGMDQKEVRQIFQKFYRTRRAEESGEAGTGIGLSIVEQIIVQHGGAIEVSSSPGRGSCFTLVLPARAAAGVSAS